MCGLFYFMAIPSKEPEAFRAGDTVEWTKSFSDYPANDGWVLTYALRGKTIINITATASGADHSVNLTAAQTASYNPGDYRWESYLTKSSLSKRHTVADGLITILVNLAGISTGFYDGRSHVKKVLDSIEAVIEKRATQEDLSTSIDGQTVVGRMPFDQLVMMHDRYKAFYQKELDATRFKDTGINPRRIGLRLKRV